MNDEPAASQPRTQARVVLLGVLAVVVLAFVAVFWWASVDPVVALEEDVAQILDNDFSGRVANTWCLKGCSATGHEWHDDRPLTAVADLVADVAGMVGAEAVIEPGATGAALVRVQRDTALVLIGITDPTWSGTSSESTGVAIWFTSVTALDG